MITNGGKEIIAKFLLGQAPAYATHISLGCGAKPNTTGSFSEKETMDFEMIRVPISSRGFVNESGVTKISLSAEMPVENRYEISEVGIWSAGSNSAAVNSDSRALFTFDVDEGWQLHKTETPGLTGPIPPITQSLDGGDNSNNINLPVTNNTPIFATTSDNETLLSSIRRNRQEGARFLNNTIFMRGDTSSISSSFVVTAGSTGNSSHIHLDGRNINLTASSPNDEIKIALSIVPQQESNALIPYRTRIVVEFLKSETDSSTGYAKLNHEILSTDQTTTNKYLIITKKIKDLQTSSDFSWKDVRLVRVYASIYKNLSDTQPTSDYYMCLDGMRFDNINTPNPLYVMSGYSVVNTASERPIIKIANTSNYIEYRLSLGVS